MAKGSRLVYSSWKSSFTTPERFEAQALAEIPRLGSTHSHARNFLCLSEKPFNLDAVLRRAGLKKAIECPPALVFKSFQGGKIQFLCLAFLIVVGLLFSWYIHFQHQAQRLRLWVAGED